MISTEKENVYIVWEVHDENGQQSLLCFNRSIAEDSAIEIFGTFSLPEEKKVVLTYDDYVCICRDGFIYT